MIIKTARQQPTLMRLGIDYRTFLVRLAAQRWPDADLPIDWAPGGSALEASIGSSNWRVMCDVCTELIIYEPGELFVCPECLNAQNKYRARRVKMPDERAEIERLLLERPVPETRDWNPHETVENLRAENNYRIRAVASGLRENEALAIMDNSDGDVQQAEKQLDAELEAREKAKGESS